MKSEKVEMLAAALSKAQSEMPAAPMLAQNPFLKNKYADLGTIIKTATPVLSRNGLAVSQQVVTESDRIGVTTTLLHSSGQWIEGTVSLPLDEERGKSMAQVAGSVITYLRRYSYGAIVGIITDEDTDGQHPAAQQKSVTPQPEAQKLVQDEPKPETGMSLEMAETERNTQNVLYKDIDTEKLSHMLNAMLKIKTATPKSFTDDHARKCDAIKTILAARAVTQGA